jgi:pimeloyl-ACP methyl ester carboxylesterase
MRIIITVLSILAFATAGYAMDIQEEFDPIGPPVKHFETSTGKDLVYIDEGQPDWKPVLFVGGAGTSVRVFGLTEFARTLREQLKLRVISVERNGFGETLYDSDWGYEDYAEEVGELLGYLGVDRFRGIAISGGGPYLATIAARMPEKVVSVHFAAALSYSAGDSWNCALDWDTVGSILRPLVANPIAWWDLGPDTSIHAVPGFQDLANDDGARTLFH